MRAQVSVFLHNVNSNCGVKTQSEVLQIAKTVILATNFWEFIRPRQVRHIIVSEISYLTDLLFLLIIIAIIIIIIIIILIKKLDRGEDTWYCSQTKA